ncbi:MAG TPA: hypothetical protein VFD64_15435 [Gemmatimonadaceae bacterium]|nr:hypothetical protein [Gemmatimonadaceae bacterium]
MKQFAPVFAAMLSAVVLPGCSETPIEVANTLDAPSLAKGGPGGGGTEFATRTALPALQKGVHGEAYAISRAGGLIGGYSWDQQGYMHPVTWSLQNGTWKITAYPWDASATSAIIRGVDDQGNKAGNFWPGSAPRPVLWNAAGAYTVLGCGELGEAHAISAVAQVAVGRSGPSATVWSTGQCAELLPPLTPGAASAAYAVNSDGMIAGGSSAGLPVRWRRVDGTWQVEQLDSRSGAVRGSNSAGDLVGYVQDECCTTGVIWFVDGSSRTLPTLGGVSTSPRAINSAREVVGLSTRSNGSGWPFIWSETLGMRELPVSDGAWAFALSDPRGDGTRVVVGAGGRPFAAQVWVVRNP